MKLIETTTKELQTKLADYLESEPNFRLVFDHARAQFNASELTAHNWEHAYRDTINAIVIGEAEGADMAIVLPAAVAHDIGFLYGAAGPDHGEVGAENLQEFLEDAGAEYPHDKVAEMRECIRTHKGSMHGHSPETLEAKVVADADLLEKFGPFGVYQNIRTMTEFNRNFIQSTERFSTMEKLTMCTKTGEKLAEPGRDFVTHFFKELIEAAEPYGEIQ